MWFWGTVAREMNLFWFLLLLLLLEISVIPWMAPEQRAGSPLVQQLLEHLASARLYHIDCIKACERFVSYQTKDIPFLERRFHTSWPSVKTRPLKIGQTLNGFLYQLFPPFSLVLCFVALDPSVPLSGLCDFHPHAQRTAQNHSEALDAAMSNTNLNTGDLQADPLRDITC